MYRRIVWTNGGGGRGEGGKGREWGEGEREWSNFPSRVAVLGLLTWKASFQPYKTHTNFVRHGLFCLFFIEDSWDEPRDMQWFSNVQHHSFKDGKCLSDIVWENVFTVKYRAICCGLQHFRLYTPGVTLETPSSKINIPVCIITCVWKSETICLIL